MLLHLEKNACNMSERSVNFLSKLSNLRQLETNLSHNLV